jgi:hypothetical protein
LALIALRVRGGPPHYVATRGYRLMLQSSSPNYDFFVQVVH